MFHVRRINGFALTAAAALAGLGMAGAAHAAIFVEGADPTTTFASTLLDDVTASGGGDSSTSTTANTDRNLAITTGATPQTLTITGIAFNFRGDTATTTETVTVEVIYFGNDGIFNNTADNVNLGTRTASLTFGATNQYTAVFDTAMVAEFAATQNRFRFNISSTGNMRFKTFTAAQSPSGQGGVKISVGGSSVIPEPGSIALLGLGGLLLAGKRRSSKAA